jgi:hypothetical protein
MVWAEKQDEICRRRPRLHPKFAITRLRFAKSMEIVFWAVGWLAGVLRVDWRITDGAVLVSLSVCVGLCGWGERNMDRALHPDVIPSTRKTGNGVFGGECKLPT